MQIMTPDEISRFVNNKDVVQLPNLEEGANPLSATDSLVDNRNTVEEIGASLITPSIEEDISADVIKNVSIKETDSFETPSYLIDISNIEMSQATLETLKGMLGGGNTAVYVKTVSNSIIKVGYGDEYRLYMVLEETLSAAFNGLCRVYKNNGDGFKKVTRTDVSSVRLNL